MFFRIRPLRLRGRRLPWREIFNGPVYQGDLLTYELDVGGQRVRAASLASIDPAAARALPDLYEPVLVGIAPLAMVLRGYERQRGADGPYSVIQEWHCELPQRLPTT